MSMATTLQAIADRLGRIERGLDDVRFCRQVREKAREAVEAPNHPTATDFGELSRATEQFNDAVDRLLEDASRR